VQLAQRYARAEPLLQVAHDPLACEFIDVPRAPSQIAESAGQQRDHHAEADEPGPRIEGALRSRQISLPGWEPRAARFSYCFATLREALRSNYLRCLTASL